jgi:hypothetical protein
LNFAHAPDYEVFCTDGTVIALNPGGTQPGVVFIGSFAKELVMHSRRVFKRSVPAAAGHAQTSRH